MKDWKLNIVSLILVMATCLCLSLKGQETFNNPLESKAKIDAAYEKLKTTSYRLVSQSFFSENAKDELFKSEILEFISPTQKRKILVYYEANNKPDKYESLFLGSEVFSRKNEGKWKRTDYSKLEKENIKSGKAENEKSELINTKFKYLADEILNNQRVKVYEEVNLRNLKGIGYEVAKKASLSTQFEEKIKYWLDVDNGLLLKSEKQMLFGRTITKEVINYEYNPKLNIEVPNVTLK